jgi:asparagine synthase (glutamine-hydrolysing)
LHETIREVIAGAKQNMCGIAGLVGCCDRERIQRMTQILAHRGPDSFGIEVFEQTGVALGHRRLSILDLSERGHQPMSDSEQCLWITYNGEVYNYEEIRGQLLEKGHRFRSNTDTEVILYAYKQWGPDCLNALNGMYAFAIWDAKNRTLFAARDRLGIKPFYYHHSGERFVFASEIKAILESGIVKKQVDYEALHTPAMYQASPKTGFSEIQKLPPASCLTFRDGELALRRYWKLEPVEQRPPLDDARQHLDDLINRAVQRQMISDVPVGAFLSGGLDSSLIVALMTKHTRKPVSTFTIKYSDADQKFERMPDDSRYARKVAGLLGCSHRELIIAPDVTELLPKMVWHLDEPLSDPAAINTYLISKTARENGVVVLLNGMGGDEVFGGYRKHLACLLADHYQAFVPELTRTAVTRIVDALPAATGRRGIRLARWAKRFVSFASLPRDERYFVSGFMESSKYRSLFSWQHTVQHELLDSYIARRQREVFGNGATSYLTEMCLADTEVYLPDHNLTYSDKCTMAAGVEGRPPLTDHPTIEFMFSLHPRFRIRRSTQKYLLKKVAERYLPNEIIYRPKAPFGAPLRAWIRGALAEMINDYLSIASLKRRGIYRTDFVWQAIENDRNGREDNALLIWRLLCNELWLRTFFS